MDWIVIGLAAALSIVLPVAIIYVRQTVKAQRRDVINDLAAIFEPGKPGCEQIIPSFEFVKFKYSIPCDPDETAAAHAAHRRPPQPEGDFSKTMFVVSSFPLMLVLFALGLVAFTALISLVGEPKALRWMPSLPGGFSKDGDKIGLTNWLAMMVVAYIAAYLYVLRQLLRAIANFELSPMTLLLSAIHVLFGVVSAIILASVASDVIPGGAVTTSVLLLAAFAVGFVPELGVRTLLRGTKLYLFKRDDENVYKSFMVTPVEAIDGIDSEVSSRLSLHNIVSVQNLATANPIMLFVETPYGVYQIIDWVAQAQLCSALGTKALVEFWKLGIRTIFDLERAMIGGNSTRELRHEVGKIIVLGRSEEERKRLGLHTASTPSADTDKTVLALGAVILDDLHIQRLRQIANRIANRLGEENLRLIHIAKAWTPAGAAAQDDRTAEQRAGGGNGHTAPEGPARDAGSPAPAVTPAVTPATEPQKAA
jgi:hypothetical protein